MPQPTKPTSMSLSEWRLWCCCYPPTTPPTSSLSQREHVSLEEFDPGNRLSTSRAYEQRRPSTSLPPSTPKNSNESTPPAVATRRAETISQPLRSERPKPKTEKRGGQRPTTVLLPSPPQRPSESRESKIAKSEHSKPQMVRQDSEHWWQVGRRMLERKEKEGSSPQSSRERK